MKIGIFYGSSGGMTGEIAEILQGHFDLDEDDCVNMEDFDGVETMQAYDVLLLGSSTWGQGDVQRDWVDFLFEMDNEEFDFSGKRVAFFGTGDHKTHGEHFVSALGKLHDAFVARGAIPIGKISTEGYDYEESLAEKEEGFFVGLAIDAINERTKSHERIAKWVEQVQKDLGV